MNFRIIVCVFALGFSATCSGTTTDDFLATNISQIDKRPAEPLLPADGGTSTSLETQFSWTSRAGYSKYTVELSTRSDFANQIAGSPFTATGSSLSVTLPDAVKYWWRVKTYLMQGEPIVGSFEAFDDAIYVYCRESTTCDDTGQLGNKSKPFQTIRTAISTAKALGKSVKVASRGVSQQAYAESISLADGVSVYGGYLSTLSESTRNATANVTAITSSAIPVTAANTTSKMVFDGFKITGILGYGVYLDQCNGNFTLQNSVVVSGNVTSGNTTGLTINGGNPNVTSSTITAGNATATTGAGGAYAVLVQASSTANIFGNNLNGGVTAGSGSSQGIRILASSPTVTQNIIVAGNPSNAANNGESYGVGVSVGGSPVIKNNTITAGNPAGTGDSIGVVIITNGSALLVNNTIMSGITSTGQNAAVQLNVISSSRTVIVNNIMGSIDTTGAVNCIQEFATGSNPSQLLNNLFFGCATALYNDADGSGAITAIGTVNSASSVGAGNTATGNVTITGTQNPFVNLAAQNYRLQNNGAPMTAQQWLDIAYGGLNTNSSTYGAITTDLDGKTRTATAGGATNTSASGYSIGAYEF